MGVLGLWQLIDAVGHPVKIESMEGKRLGVDANVWLYKFIRGFREKDNAPNIEAHKLGLFNRISKLLFYKIKPVFVFDGPAPVLKRRTLEKRQNVRSKQVKKVQDAAVKLLAEQLRQQYPDANIDDLHIQVPDLISHNLVAAEKLGDEDRELFTVPVECVDISDSSDWGEFDSDDDDVKPVIPKMPVRTSDGKASTDTDRDTITANHVKREDIVYHVDSDSGDDLLFQPSAINHRYNNVDVQSDEFKSLPPEIRYEILQDIKESNKRIKRNTLPEDSESFSSFQLQRLKSRRSIQEKIEEAEKDICSTYTGESDGRTVQSFRLQSDASSKMVLFQKKGEIADLKVKGPDPTNYKPAEKPKEEPKPLPKIDYSDTDSGTEIDEPGPSQQKSPIKSSPVKQNTSPLSLKAQPIKGLKQISQPAQLVRNVFDRSALIAPKIVEPTDGFLSESSGSTPSNSPLRSPSPPTSPLPQTSPLPPTSPLAPTSPRVESESQDKPITIMHEKSPQQQVIDLESTDSEVEELESVAEPEVEVIPKISKTPANLADSIVWSDFDESMIPVPPVSDVPVTKDKFLPSTSSSQPIPTTRTEKLSPLDQPASSSQVEPNPQPEITTSSSQSKQQPQRIANQHFDNLRQLEKDAKRTTNKVTTKIVDDAKELLRLFGVPYIDAPGEAEAQCALLESLKLTEGTITDDSDVWLFGAQHVYRHFFSDDKWLLRYKMCDVEFHCRLNRENLVCFAMLVGSDYTTGIAGVGPVAAIEILSEFPGEGLEPLIKYKNWKTKYQLSKGRVPGSKKREKLLKFDLPEDFPSKVVFDGYLRPMADTSTEQFSWGMPELDELREYARRNFGWDPKKIDEKLLPIMKRLSERKTQPTIDSFFFKRPETQNPELFRSKRVNAALSKITAKQNDEVALSESDEEENDNNEHKSSNIKKNNEKQADKKPTAKRAPRKMAKGGNGTRGKRKAEPEPEVSQPAWLNDTIDLTDDEDKEDTSLPSTSNGLRKAKSPVTNNGETKRRRTKATRK